MSLPGWPSQTPTAARDGWQMPEMFRSPIVSEMDGGNQRLRSMPGSNVATINYPLAPLTDSEWGYLETFLRSTIHNGASRFTMTLLTGSSAVSKTVALDGGKSPTVTRSGGMVHVTLQLRVYGMA